ncbi:phosphate acyltransferase PlsX [Candidatus Magnetominusculus xianensis]|uniref:Phosphate acyltransferase n=1 Tax=Candidatus Magnetominusculus xianensis TaxID=1748249 RepID=A0ABR5SDT1_9BACT|nr:phosphate acyltransferase PlsX [Candidatus Magnetominusculus xianensis]KWT79593.1 phosphate acyltransferase [Candidatus Magnetominusculus xianensis]MBF0403806.1 phosphate acyltransferase PlsX [Nitrospirota bacterium]
MKIALDAMGGDNAPGVNVEGALLAVAEYDDISVELIGDSDVLLKRLKAVKRYDEKRITVRHASEVVDMDEATSQALRKKKDSSIRVAVDMVKKGEAAAVVSAGHSGVAMATALTVLKKAPGVDRPAIAVLMPTVKGRFLLIDAGANVDCKPDNLLQFALMGSAYFKAVYGIEEPKVSLMSIGEEDTKGNELTKEVFKLLKTANINFTGNIEGKDVFTGLADVVVCDGFIGNTILKVSEGLAEAIMKMLKAEISGRFASKLGYLMMKPAIKGFKRRTDYDESGGAPLLGINGTCIICHGRSTSKAIKNALKVANQLATVNINKIISDEIAMSHKHMREQHIAEG